MVSVYTVLYALLLFSELSSHLVAVAMPAYKVEDGVNEQDGLGLMAGDEPMTEPVVVPAMVPPVYRRNHVLDNNVRDEDGSPKIYILSVSVSSPSLKTFASLSMFKKSRITKKPLGVSFSSLVYQVCFFFFFLQPGNPNVFNNALNQFKSFFSRFHTSSKMHLMFVRQ